MTESVIARNAKRIISERGIKQKALAARMGITEGQLSNMLTGRRVIRDTDIVALVNVLGVTPNEIFEEEGQ